MAGPDLILTGELAAEIERALGQAAASRIASAGRATEPSLGVEVRQFGPISATLVRHPRWYYGYFGGLTGLGADDWQAFDEGLSWLRSASAPVRVYLSPFTPPVGAASRYFAALASRGLAPSDFMSVLAAPARDDQAVPPVVDVCEAEHADLDPFLDIWLAPVDEPERSSLLPLARLEFSDWRSYVAFLDGEPAGVGSLYVGGRIGVLAAAVTLPRLRGRGVQTALLRRRIADSARAGCELVVSQASPGTISERNMQRVGLRPAYSQVLFVERPAPRVLDGEPDGC
jgi:GNAT superfamily N-acetyltransferase